MQANSGNRGETIPAGVKSVDRDPIADMADFDKLPAKIRRRIASLACRVHAGEIRKALDEGFPPTRMETDLMLFERKYLDALRKEREDAR